MASGLLKSIIDALVERYGKRIVLQTLLCNMDRNERLELMLDLQSRELMDDTMDYWRESLDKTALDAATPEKK